MRCNNKQSYIVQLLVFIFVALLSATPVSALAIPSDINSHWSYSKIVEYCLDGKISSFPDGTFKPNNPITREDAITILVKAFGLGSDEIVKFEEFKDANQISSLAVKPFNTAISLGIMVGYPDQSIQPKGTISRAEAITLIDKTETITKDSASAKILELTTTEKAENEFKTEVIRLVNIERTNAGLSELTYMPTLDDPADIRAKESASVWSHTRIDGTSCFTVFSDFSLSFRAVGENLGYGYETPSQLVNAWMNSPTHRENILNSTFKYIGIGYYENNNGSIYCSQLFYTPPTHL